MLDGFAGNRELLDAAARLYQEWRAAAAELEELERNEQEKLRLLDLWSFQRKEIESAALAARRRHATGERTAGAAERPEAAGERRHGLRCGLRESGIGRGAGADCGQAGGGTCRIDASLDGLREHLKAAELSLQEVAYALRDYLSGLEANPGRLEEVETPAGSDCTAQAEVRPIDRRDPDVSGRGARRRSRRWNPPASAWRRCARMASGWPRSSRRWRAH